MGTEKSMNDIMNLCKNRGFVFANSEIYGGLANAWDYGPLGVELKNNIKNAWWRKFVQESAFNVGLDCAILTNTKVLVASKHVGNFSDPLVDCKDCKTRHRADKIATEQTGVNAEGLKDEELEEFIKKNNVSCPECGGHNFTSIRNFNLMFKTFQGVIEESKSELFLRPETAQGIFVNFVNVQKTMRKKLPFGIAQIGKAFRNEITPGNFIFRTREFEQMELEFFCKPGADAEWFGFWSDFCHKWLLSLNMTKENLRRRAHKKEELSHYSKATTDIEYNFPFGWGELCGIACRGDYDLSQHEKHSAKNLGYFDPETDESYLPHVVEPSLGADRAALAFICDAYASESLPEGDSRIVLKLHPALAPIKACVLPLTKKLSEKATTICSTLSKHFSVDFDETGSIGKRYRRQDEIGTPFCITYDFDTENDGTVTVRDRDSMQQERIKIAALVEYIAKKIVF
ncbi:MAG: glycine--tRNA ligase [Oscillospiraceae bacterium]|jgi:glycyl-tRNA synthetase|nr:glycine--tRNA ligase [Oscillospiraceae bacterium]